MNRYALSMVLLLAAALPASGQDPEVQMLKKQVELLKVEVAARDLEIENKKLFIEILNKKLSTLEAENSAKAARIADLTGQLEVQLKQITELTAAPAREMKRAEEEFALVMAWLRGGGAPEKLLEGKVTAVGDEIGLVVISVGKDDGVLEKDEFAISRAGEFVAKIVIDRVDRKWSAGKVVLKKSDPRVADDVFNSMFVVSAPLAPTAVKPGRAVVLAPPRPPPAPPVAVPAVSLRVEPVSPKSSDAIREIRKELDEVRRQVRALSDQVLPSWHGYGLASEEAPEELRTHLGIARGLMIRRVREGSPAEKVGLKSYDVVLDLTEAQLLDAIDKKLALRVMRQGREKTLGER